ncbi:NAD(P)-dependent glycerol-3-phosphate dehydrogenase [Planktomarina temperata]|nr:NAD(P)-dependent glycerol-3-phosphate dehydrogenase [Planktomarina temperata]
MTVCILGAGAFGTALAVALSDRHDVRLWGRDGAALREMAQSRKSPRLPDVTLVENITVTCDAKMALQGADFILSAIPLQATHAALSELVPLFAGQPLIGCSKGVDLTTGLGGYSVLRSVYVAGPSGLLTGPSFAADIAGGLPTALTLAAAAQEDAGAWQAALSTETLRLYTSSDPIGAELGGALKNVIAIACGATIGVGLGQSARAALITRGQAEIMRYAVKLGAQPETLAGLSGFGDLCLTCTSEKSRNYQFGLALGRGQVFDNAVTVEGRATALALLPIMERLDIDMPITKAVAGLCLGTITVSQALAVLMARPLRKEI